MLVVCAAFDWNGWVSMAFAKADQILDLAVMASSRSSGITLQDVCQRFGISHRTAQRMMRVLEGRYLDIETSTDDDGRKRWHLPPGNLQGELVPAPDELAALDLAIEALNQARRADEASRLADLRDKVLAMVPRRQAARIETDHEALLEAQGLAFRPGPKSQSDPRISQRISEAIKGCRILRVLYGAHRDEAARWRDVMPYGVLTGLRPYLLVRRSRKPDRTLTYRMDFIQEVEPTEQTFTRDPSFDLRQFAARAFGIYQSEAEFGEVVWRFQPGLAASRARQFEFHPHQTMTDGDDGSLTVRFHASGHLEMCWYLYSWGDKVEVLAPEALRELVRGHQRSDFATTP